MAEHYDIAFLGGGPAGYQGAIRAAQLGARVAVVEESFLGGVCLNWGCIPTKTVRASAEVGRTHAPGPGVWLSGRGGNHRTSRPSSPAKSGWFQG